jgi:hypothetical protein
VDSTGHSIHSYVDNDLFFFVSQMRLLQSIFRQNNLPLSQTSFSPNAQTTANLGEQVFIMLPFTKFGKLRQLSANNEHHAALHN